MVVSIFLRKIKRGFQSFVHPIYVYIYAAIKDQVSRRQIRHTLDVVNKIIFFKDKIFLSDVLSQVTLPQ